MTGKASQVLTSIRCNETANYHINLAPTQQLTSVRIAIFLVSPLENRYLTAQHADTLSMGVYNLIEPDFYVSVQI
jgi:hypothetical protein